MMTLLAPAIPAPCAGAVRQALAQARDALGCGAPEVLLINDPQRATATPDVLARAGTYFDLSRTRVVVAAGSHTFGPAAREALQQSCAAIRTGAWSWHDARSTGLVAVGGEQGWRAHPWVAGAQSLLAIGSVEPHYFAGFSGAHKTLTIGCAGYADIERNHAGALDPACRPCRLEGTPVHDGIVGLLRALERGRRMAVVNLFQIGPDIVDAAGGAPLAALQALVPKVQAAYLRRIPRAADALVAEVTGALACSFYQAEKGIKNSEWAVRDHGVIVLEAACPQGIGQDAFVNLLREAPTHAAARTVVQQRGYRLGDHKAVRLRYLTDAATRGVRVYVVSPGISAAEAVLLGIRKAGSAAEALHEAGVAPHGADVCRVEDAGNTCVEAGDGNPLPAGGEDSITGRK
ncbi:MAG: lactate racemase domain-containing protein [bacterium]